jgi:acetoacetate decarboxylase
MVHAATAPQGSNDDVMKSSRRQPPLTSPSYRKAHTGSSARDALIHYESDPAVIRQALPKPLDDGNHVIFEWMTMLDSSGFGSYQESGINIAARWNGTPCNYSLMMFLDDESPTTGGREIWGFPKKIGNPDLRVIHDTLTGTLHYAEREVALGTMAYKYQSLAQDHGETLAAMKNSTSI